MPPESVIGSNKTETVMIQTLQRFTMLSAMLIAYLTSLAYDFEQGGIYYKITSETDRAVEVTNRGNHGWYSGDIEIPKKLIRNGKTYTVTSIGEDAFYSCSDLTSVTIPNSVTSIDARGFGSCSGLTSVTIPNSVTSIAFEAFSCCSGLTSVTIPNSVISIGDGAFSECWSLTSVSIPNSVTSIGEKAFYNCNVLTSVTIPNSVTSIGDRAFSYCSRLTLVSIGNSVTSIGAWAFSRCSGLTSVTIPNSVTSIGDVAFGNCGNLDAINVHSDNTVFCSQDGILYNKELTELLCCPGKKTSVTIPNSVTSIGDYAFYGCSGLTSVSIPNSVTSIGDYAFDGYCSLEMIYSQIVEPFECYPGFSDFILKNTILYVPKGTISAYEKVDPWRNFWNIEEIDYSGVQGIDPDGDVRMEVSRYNLHGIEVDSDYKGLIIIRYSDGSYCKMYAK